MPTIFIEGSFRFYFFSKEELRKHVHVSTPDGELKVWLEPKIEIAKIIHMSNTDVNTALKIIQTRKEV